MKIGHKIFSATIIFLNLAIILYWYFFARRGYLEGAPGWILEAWGAPTTFLLFPIFKVAYKLLSNNVSQYIVISLLFQLQYQLIGFFLFRIKRPLTKVLTFILIIIIISFSYKKMWIVIAPYSDAEREESAQIRKILIGDFEIPPQK